MSQSEHMDVLKVVEVGRQEGGGYILEGISFVQGESRKIAIAGATGSGKTTLLKIIAGLVQADTGEVFFENRKVKGPAEQLIPGFPGIAYLSQHFELRNNYRVEEILEYANTLPGAAELYEVCRIGHLLRRKTDQLSGGERQRIALARLLSTSPRLLLLDEPYSNLDPGHKSNLKAVIRDISEKLKITCILASHEPLVTLSLPDEILVLEGGHLIQKDAPEQIYRRPVNEYAAGLFGGYTMIDLRQAAALHVKPGIFRPEHFKIGKSDGRSVSFPPEAPGPTEGEVRRVSFAGSYYEVEVVLEGAPIMVSSLSGGYSKGDRVSVSIDYDNYHP